MRLAENIFAVCNIMNGLLSEIQHLGDTDVVTGFKFITIPFQFGLRIKEYTN